MKYYDNQEKQNAIYVRDIDPVAEFYCNNEAKIFTFVVEVYDDCLTGYYLYLLSTFFSRTNTLRAVAGFGETQVVVEILACGSENMRSLSTEHQILKRNDEYHAILQEEQKFPNDNEIFVGIYAYTAADLEYIKKPLERKFQRFKIFSHPFKTFFFMELLPLQHIGLSLKKGYQQNNHLCGQLIMSVD